MVMDFFLMVNVDVKKIIMDEGVVGMRITKNIIEKGSGS